MRHAPYVPLFSLLLSVAAGCEDRGIGRPCDLDVSGQGAAIKDQALECPSNLCLRQAAPSSEGAPPPARCTARCETDQDCEDGQLQEPGMPGNQRCRSGFVCGVAMVTGSTACCEKLCLCKDTLSAAERSGAAPRACDLSRNPSVCSGARGP